MEYNSYIKRDIFTIFTPPLIIINSKFAVNYFYQKIRIKPNFDMNRLYFIVVFLFFITNLSYAQYTEVINSNRPGASYSAFAVGKNVLQGEAGFYYERQDHSLLETEANRYGVDYAIRYGFLFEQLA